MLIDTLSKVKNYNAQSKYFEAPYLSSEDMENIESALGKQIPKKIIVSGKGLLSRCPTCKCSVTDNQEYCSICGQHLEPREDLEELINKL